jgi:hypothetical protein
MNKKIKILVIPSDRYGCGFFRSLQPHQYIQEHYSDLFEIDIRYELPKDIPLEKFFGEYDIIHMHKQLDNNCELINMMKYDSLLDQVKTCLINNGSIKVDDSEDQSVYLLYNSILGTQDVFNNVFFTAVNKNNIISITSSILTFLNKVQTQNIRGASSHYANLIIQSNKRYGKKIRQAICRFVRSKASKEAALYNLLTDLNKAK